MPESSTLRAAATLRASGDALIRVAGAAGAGLGVGAGAGSGASAGAGSGASAGAGSGASAGAGSGAGAGAGSGAGAGAGSGAGAGAGSGAGAGAGSGAGAGASPSSCRTARVAPIAAFPPSSIRISERIPSSKASIAMVALSVSISAISSPISTWSPTFLSQRTTVPSVMVSESLGISICVGMAGVVRLELGSRTRPGQYRGKKLFQGQRDSFVAGGREQQPGGSSSKQEGPSAEGEPAS